MTGWQSKKESSKVRWLGPYAPTDRHADDATLAELVRLRVENDNLKKELADVCLLYTSPSPRDRTRSRMPSSA